MPLALICSQANLEGELGHTLLWRDGMERHFATQRDEAQVMALAARPSLVLVDRDLPEALQLVRAIRTDSSIRGTSVAIVAGGDFDQAEVELLEAGANAILRLPAGPDWDERLVRLIDVPVRRDARIPVCFEVSREEDGGLSTLLGTIVNLSACGMLLETTIGLTVGEDVDFSFRLPVVDIPVRGCGRVLRQARPFRFGIEFYGLEGDACEHIRRFIGGGPPNGL